MKFVKICGITTPELAFFAASQGADIIGILQFSESKRFVDLVLASEISIAAKEGGARVACIYVQPEEEDVLLGKEQINFDFLQIYGRSPTLPFEISKIYVNKSDVCFCKEKDFLLLDHEHGGTGRALDWTSLMLPKGASWFLAGGLKMENIDMAIHLLNPDGVDVSSGVEKDGKKDKGLIKQFIEKVKSYE